MVLAWGRVFGGVFSAHARPTLAVLWTFPHTFPEDTNFGKHGDEGQRRRGMGKTVVVVGGGGQNKSTNAHVNTGRQAHTHTGHLNGPVDQEATNPEFVEMSDFDEEEGKGAGPWCLKC